MSTTVPSPQRHVPIGSIGIIVAGMVCQELGASFAVLLFPLAGAVGTVMMRLVFSAIVLLLVARPRLRGHDRRGWLTVIGFGLCLGAMNLVFYEALTRLSLGVTVTIEVLGPLVLSVVTSRRAASWLWAVLAFAGVALLARGGFGTLDPIGVLCAFGAAAFWAGYILLSKHTGTQFGGIDGLAIAMAIGGIVILPFGIVSAGPDGLQPWVLGVGAAVAVLSSAIPYAFELLALRRVPASAFSVLMSVSPAIASLVGFFVLRQALTALDMVAIVLVIAASIGAVRSARARQQAEPLA